MGRAPCCTKVGLHRGPWTAREDSLLTKYIQVHSEGNWRSLPKKAGLLRCGKSCRLRWMNYLRPDIKRGNISPDEDDLIIKMHALLGNRWSLIAGRLPGRTDNEIKNYWNTHLSKKLRSQGNDPNTHRKLSESHDPGKKRRNKQKGKPKPKPNAETEKQKAHNPKAIRIKNLSSSSFPLLMSRNSSFEWATTGSGGSSSQEGERGIFGRFNEDGDFLIGDHDHLMNGSDLECQSQVPLTPPDDSTLEKLYEEYLQLLKTEEDQVQLDSFAESLLV